MKKSLKGYELPESWGDYQRLKKPLYTVCLDCREKFSPENVTSPAGWRETQITGMCENCFDHLFDISDQSES